jgi:hypothetical protein
MPLLQACTHFPPPPFFSSTFAYLFFQILSVLTHSFHESENRILSSFWDSYKICFPRDIKNDRNTNTAHLRYNSRHGSLPFLNYLPCPKMQHKPTLVHIRSYLSPFLSCNFFNMPVWRVIYLGVCLLLPQLETKPLDGA